MAKARLTEPWTMSPGGPGSEPQRGDDVLLGALGDDGAASHAAEQRGVHDRDGQHGVVQPRPQHGGDGDGEDQGGEAEQHVHDPPDRQVGPPAGVAADEAERGAGREGDRDAGDRDAQRDAAPVDGPAEHVAAEAVGPEEVGGRRRAERLGHLHLGRVVGGHHVGERGQQDQAGDDADPEEDQPVAQRGAERPRPAARPPGG
jgi:hypothetical protein